MYATLMVHLQLGQSNQGLLKIAGDLAESFHASVVIGIAACQPLPLAYGDGYLCGDVIEQDRVEIDKEIKAAETELREVLKGRVSKLEWRSKVTFGPLTDYLTEEARSADLIIVGVDRDISVFDTTRHVNMGELMMQAGRPVLIVPDSTSKLALEHVLVGWKDTRETRRAIFDALPFLKLAAQVTVVEIADKDELAAARVHVKDVVEWLGRHGVAAKSIAAVSGGEDASRLNAISKEQMTDLIVAGAYGHSRLRELVLGGVTRDLLLCVNRCSLVSH